MVFFLFLKLENEPISVGGGPYFVFWPFFLDANT
jgi:hypothetical protein